MAEKINVVLAVKQKGASIIQKTNKELVGMNSRLKNIATTAKNYAYVGGTIAAVALTIGTITKKTIMASATMQDFRVQLLAVSKTAEEADLQLAKIREFARTSPLDTVDVVTSFTRLRAVGIEPTMKAMETMGGIAVLMRRDIADVSNALVGLNKRTLREFGIEIDRRGKKAIIMSGNIRKEVVKDSATIRKALIETWAERFPDAMALAADTTSSKIKVMNSEIFELAASVGHVLAPAFDAVTVAIGNMAGALNKAKVPARLAEMYSFLFGKKSIAVIKATRLGEAAIAAKNAGRVFDAQWEATKKLTHYTDAIKSIDPKGANAADIDFLERKAADVRRQIEVYKTAIKQIDLIRATDADDKAAGFGKFGQKTDEEVAADKTAADKTAAARAKRIKEQHQAEIKARDEILATNRKRRAVAQAEEERIVALQNQLTLARLNTMEDASSREIEILLETQRQELAAIKGGDNEKEALARLHAAQMEVITKAQAQTSAEIKAAFDVKVKASASNLAHGLIDLSSEVVNANVKDAKKRQVVLAGIAIAEAAAGAVSGVKSAMELKWPLNLIMAAASVAEVAALTVSQISAIQSQSFGVGTRSARGGRSLVGEYGPEHMDVPRGARIDTAATTLNNSYASTTNSGNTFNLTSISEERVVSILQAAMRNGKANDLVHDLSTRLT